VEDTEEIQVDTGALVGALEVLQEAMAEEVHQVGMEVHQGAMEIALEVLEALIWVID
jgi:hypothetical protein